MLDGRVREDMRQTKPYKTNKTNHEVEVYTVLSVECIYGGCEIKENYSEWSFRYFINFPSTCQRGETDHISPIRLFLFLSVALFLSPSLGVSLSIYLCLFIYLTAYVSVCMYVHLSICLSIYLTIYPCISIYISI